MSKHPYSKPVREMIRNLRKDFPTLEHNRTGRGHVLIKASGPKGVCKTIMSMTPSCPRAGRNSESQFRRQARQVGLEPQSK